MKSNMMMAAAVAVLFAANAYGEQTYGERLGWGPNDRVVIFHIDDGGMSHDSNVGCIRALTEGLASSVSVMMPCPWVPEFVDFLKKNPEIDAGLHLTLNAEWEKYAWGPLAGKNRTPGLVDERGAMWRSTEDTVKNATPEEVEAEVRAQLDRARAMGFEPTHLDTHMGTILATMEFAQVYMEIGIETGIPVMAPVGHLTLVQQAEPERDVAPFRVLGKRLWDAGLPVIDDLHNTSYGWKTTDKTDLYIDALKELKPGITQFIMHCTLPSENFAHISSSGVTREGDLNAMIDPRLKAFIEKDGIIVTTWRELKERRDKVKK